MNQNAFNVVQSLKEQLPNCVVNINYGEKTIFVDIYATYNGQIGWCSLWIDIDKPKHWDVVECPDKEQLPAIKRTISTMIGA